jgi:hypothetical protein
LDPKPVAQNFAAKSMFRFLVLLIGISLCQTVFIPVAHAQCCNCPRTVDKKSTSEWKSTTARLQNHVRSELTGQRVWLVSVFWEDNILPALMLMSDQLTTTAMQQVQIFGSFMDASNQMETQQTFRRLRAQAQKDYQPSEGVCELGSAVKSLAASERKGEFAAHAISQRQQDRALGQYNTASATGYGGDISARLEQFKTTYCDPNDNNSGLAILCANSSNQIGAEKPERSNADIDYVRTLATPLTLDVDFTNPIDGKKPRPAEEDLFALSSNLYGHFVFQRPTQGLTYTEGANLTPTQESIMDMRAILAKRSVAENSFNAIAGMKASGSGGSAQYLRSLIRDLGIQNDKDITALIGQNPSYHAQMEVLTRKIYQNPAFYTNLYDTPANVDRKAVALQALGLMQKFDMYKSYLRQEASLSVLLELALISQQDSIENPINR